MRRIERWLRASRHRCRPLGRRSRPPPRTSKTRVNVRSERNRSPGPIGQVSLAMRNARRWAVSRHRWLPSAVECVAESVDALGAAFGFHASEMALHFLEARGGVALPLLDLSDDAQWLTGAVGFGGVAGESLVGEVRVVEKGAGRLDDVD